MFGTCSQFQIGILKEEKENWLVCGFWLFFFFTCSFKWHLKYLLFEVCLIKTILQSALTTQ